MAKNNIFFELLSIFSFMRLDYSEVKNNKKVSIKMTGYDSFKFVKEIFEICFNKIKFNNIEIFVKKSFYSKFDFTIIADGMKQSLIFDSSDEIKDFISEKYTK